ncbi:MAG: dihydropteroate synthase, partial [Thermodesulfobacteriota bacterium]
EMERIGVDPAGIRLMTPKHLHYNLMLRSLSSAEANIIKQEILSIGGELAVSKGTVSAEVDRTDALLSGTEAELRYLTSKLSTQPFGLKDISVALTTSLDNTIRAEFTIKGNAKSISVGTTPLIMGILNVTPDSFSDGGKFESPDLAIKKALEMIDEGADIIDIGGESTRPGAPAVSEDEELKRVMPVITGLAGEDILISVDTRKAGVASRALSEGAWMINDVSAMTADPEMVTVVRESGAAIALMHMRGVPESMQDNVEYSDLIGEVFDYLAGRVAFAEAEGIDSDAIIIDPGIGFGKSSAGNFEIINRLSEFSAIGRPVLIGPSRKSFLGGATPDRLTGTTAALTASVMNGARLLRVHDVREAKEAARVVRLIKGH